MEGTLLFYTVLVIIRVIISELYVDNKTIPPIDVGGVAGGSKYIVQGILFKFTLDTCLPNGVWLYGKNKRNDEKGTRFCDLTYFYQQ